MARKMRVVQVPRAGGPLELVERDIPEPQPGWVRVKVEACGICHSDALVKEGLWPGIQYPRVPGHEVAGAIDAVGDGVTGWTPGQRVGVGWHGGHCGRCDPCRRGDLFACETQFNLNVLGVILASQAALKHFDGDGASIINISSLASTLALANAAVYSGT